MKSSLLNLTGASFFVCAVFVGNAVAQEKAAPAAATATAKAEAPAPAAPAVRPPPTAASAATDLAGIPADVLAKVEKHDCKTPVEPGKLSTNSAQKVFRNDLDTFRDCLIKYAETRQTVARAHIASANAAVAEYNEYVEKVKKEREATK
jgi:hypothetical protein